MTNFDDIKIFIGPMSTNIVDCIIEVCEENDVRIGLIPSRRQIEYTAGYVNNWSTHSFSEYVKNKSSKVVLQRDHGGRQQGSEDYYKSFKADVDSGFDLIHIDPWKKFVNIDEVVSETIENINFCYQINQNTCYEIGTEQAIHEYSYSQLDYFLTQIKNELPQSVWNQVKYAVIQAGTRISGTKNMGVFDVERCKNMVNVCHKHGLLSKEHNGDYLSNEAVSLRFNSGLDAINIAPEFGVLETNIILSHLSEQQVDKFYKTCYESNKWVKWVPDDFNPHENKREIVSICGHYVFSTPIVKELKSQIPNIETTIKQNIKNKITSLLRLTTQQE